jgi:hypothetical protein
MTSMNLILSLIFHGLTINSGLLLSLKKELLVHQLDRLLEHFWNTSTSRRIRERKAAPIDDCCCVRRHLLPSRLGCRPSVSQGCR